MPAYGSVVVSGAFRRIKFQSNEIFENRETKATGFPLHREGQIWWYFKDNILSNTLVASPLTISMLRTADGATVDKICVAQHWN